MSPCGVTRPRWVKKLFRGNSYTNWQNFHEKLHFGLKIRYLPLFIKLFETRQPFWQIWLVFITAKISICHIRIFDYNISQKAMYWIFSYWSFLCNPTTIKVTSHKKISSNTIKILTAVAICLAFYMMPGLSREIPFDMKWNQSLIFKYKLLLN